MEEKPDPKHKVPQGLVPQEVYKGVPILAYQDDTMETYQYGLSIVWYDRVIDVGVAALGKPYLALLQEVKQTIDVLLQVESQTTLKSDGTL